MDLLTRDGEEKIIYWFNELDKCWYICTFDPKLMCYNGLYYGENGQEELDGGTAMSIIGG